MSRSTHYNVRRNQRLSLVLAGLAALLVIAGLSPRARAGGVEFPDNGAVAIGRGGAYAANPDGALAISHNPAGLAQQQGLRIGLEAKLTDMNIKYTCPAGGVAADHAECPAGTSVENAGPLFFAPAGAISYGLGKVGPLTGLTFAIGGVGPSAVGKTDYPDEGPQRYGLVESDYFIAYASAAVAASFLDLVSIGVTGQLAVGSAKFKKAVWAGTFSGSDSSFDAIANVDVSGVAPTFVLGASITPMEGLAIGVSYRPYHEFVGTGKLETELPAISAAIGATRAGDQTEFVVKFPNVVRAGIQYKAWSDLLVEANFVYETWSQINSLDLLPQGITVDSNNWSGDPKPLQPSPIVRNYNDAWSLRLGGDYTILDKRLIVRAGYTFETAATPLNYPSVDNANWGRHAVAGGASVNLFGAWLDLAYAHHFIPTRVVTNSKQVQTTTPCLTDGCTDTVPVRYGDGTYEGSYNVFALSVRVPIDELSVVP